MSQDIVKIKKIDAILPQTQCQECGYPGCKPYAQAIINDNENLDKCPPGGTETLIQLGNLLATDIEHLLPEMEKKQKSRMLAVIREEECIGCVKCIKACPVDAIVGSAKQMHTVITDECTGCELCIAPCPVDCIDLIQTTQPTSAAKKAKADLSRMRFEQRNQRLEKIARQRRQKRQRHDHIKTNIDTSSEEMAAKKAVIAAAIARNQKKRQENNPW